MDYIIIFILVNIFTPGPNNIMSSSSSSKIGITKTTPFMIGVMLASFIVFLITSSLVLAFNDVTLIVKIVGYLGVIYIIYLAYKMISSSDDENVEPISPDKLLLRGMFFAFINPKTILFGITTSIVFVSNGAEFTEMIIVSIGIGILYFISQILWGIFGYIFMTYFSKNNKIFNIILASLLIFSAILLVFDTL